MPSIDVETFNGWKITLDSESGRFTARQDGSAGGAYSRNGPQEITRKDLSAVKREIASRTKGRIELMSADALTVKMENDFRSWSGPAREVLPGIPKGKRDKHTTTIVAVTSEEKLRDETGQIIQSYNGFVLADPSVIDKMNEFIEKKQEVDAAMDQEYGEWVKSLGLHRLTIDEIKKLLVESSTTIGSILDGAIGGDEQS